MLPVALLFDRGTLVLQGLPQTPDPSGIPGVFWDGRTGVWRAPARVFYALAAEMRRRGVPLADRPLPKIAPPRGCRPPELQGYQQAAVAAWRLAGGRGVVALPGARSRMEVAIATIGTPRTPVLCLVADRAAAATWTAALRQHGHRVSGLDDPRQGVQPLAPVTVASFGSACQMMWRLGDRFGLLIIDEVHHFGRGYPDDTLEMATAPLRLGLAAQPPPPGLVRDRLDTLVGPGLFQLTAAELAAPGLRRFHRVIWQLDLDADERPQVGGPRVPFPRCKQRCLSVLRDRHQGQTMLVFVADDQAARAVANRVTEAGALTRDLRPGQRQAALAAFGDGRLRVLVTTAPLAKDVPASDLPRAQVGVVLDAEPGDRQRARSLAQLLRPADNRRAVVYELTLRPGADGLDTGRSPTEPISRADSAAIRRLAAARPGAGRRAGRPGRGGIRRSMMTARMAVTAATTAQSRGRRSAGRARRPRGRHPPAAPPACAGQALGRGHRAAQGLPRGLPGLGRQAIQGRRPAMAARGRSPSRGCPAPRSPARRRTRSWSRRGPPPRPRARAGRR